MIFTTLSTLAFVASALAAAPEILYPHPTTVWENSWWHNVTWTPQAGTGNIFLIQGGNNATLKTGADLQQGRAVIQVPNGAGKATDYYIQIITADGASKSQNFAIADHAAASSVSSSLATAASSTLASISSSLSSDISSASSAAANATSSAASGASSASASATSVLGSISSGAASASSSIAANASSAMNSLSSSASSAAASATSTAPSSSGTGGASNTSSGGASNTSSAASKVELGFTKFGVTIGAGLFAVAAMSSALML